MTARIVCISRTDSALGEQIGDLVAQRLGFRYVDEQVIERAARLAQVDPALVAAVEQRQPLLRRVIAKLAAARDLVGPAALGLPTVDEQPYRASADDLRFTIRAAIHEIASEGDAVIVAHAASMTLAARTDVVRVLVTASVETRARRLAASQGMAESAAVAAITTADRNREHYFRRFYELERELPTHYDLVVNTDALAAGDAAAIIACAVSGRA